MPRDTEWRAAAHTLGLLARGIQNLNTEISDLEKRITEQVRQPFLISEQE